MRISHCKFWTKDKAFAEKYAQYYTEQDWEKYIVIFKEWLKSFIVIKESDKKYFITEEVIKTEKWRQLNFNF